MKELKENDILCGTSRRISIPLPDYQLRPSLFKLQYSVITVHVAAGHRKESFHTYLFL
jgi:hypothetical protein